MSNHTQSAIIFPEAFTPGNVSNFVSNETIAAGISAKQVWRYLTDMSTWESYYRNCESITYPISGPQLHDKAVFHFSTFEFPVLEAHVREYVEPSSSTAGRIAWSAALDGNADEATSVYHAWIVEDLPGGRVRILTQECQNGRPAEQLAHAKPNKMLLGHQDWIEGLIRAVRGEQIGKTNLGKAGFYERGDKKN